MKAYEVWYSTGRSTGVTKVIVDDSKTIEQALAEKDSDFSVDSRWCKISDTREISLSTIKINELSITEFQMLMRN